MNAYTYKKINAFTSAQSMGNPAACIYLTDDQALTEVQMLDIARQHKGFVSEVVYCAQALSGIYLTYYSSECEVDFCGHGTIACLYSLIKSSPILLSQAEMTIQTHKKGPLTVYNRISNFDAVFITAPDPVFIGTMLTAKDVAKALGIDSSKFETKLPLHVINAGLNTLIVPIKELADEISIFPNEPSLKLFCESNSIDIILIFSMQVQYQDSLVHTRVFAPRFGYLEDPATGSGNSAFGYYMLKNSLWNGEPINIEQGGNDRIFNTVKLTMQNGRLLFGGSATEQISGKYFI